MLSYLILPKVEFGTGNDHNNLILRLTISQYDPRSSEVSDQGNPSWLPHKAWLR